jgi:flagellar motor switch protein FliN
MADETPKTEKTASNDPLADELLAAGSFGDATENAAPEPAAEDAGPNLSELEALLKNANFGDAAAEQTEQAMGDELLAAARSAAPAPSMPDTMPFSLPALERVVSGANASSIDLLRDVDLNVKIELGRSRMLVEDVLKLAEGSVVELDKLAGDPVDVFVNDRLVARGEVLVLNDNFCVRVNEIVASVKEEG